MKFCFFLLTLVITEVSHGFKLISSTLNNKFHGRSALYSDKGSQLDSNSSIAQLDPTDPKITKNIISIVGRPNVGKSSIFNRITQLFHYGSVVNDSPGTTRDRQYSIADWKGKYFRIIDTGGYDSDQPYYQEIKSQIDTALKESSGIIFVVDALEGLTWKDTELRDYIFSRMRNSKNKNLRILLCVNKAESYRRGDILSQEFWKLGLGKPFPVSALHGTGLAELLDVCVEGFETGELVDDSEIAVSFIGRPNSGKSSLINRLIGQNRCIVSPEEGTTQDSTKIFVTNAGNKMALIDTAGMKLLTKDRRSYLSQKSSLRSIRSSDVCVLVVDSSWGISKNDVRMAEEIREENKAAVIVCNKWDLVDKTPSIYDNVVGYIREKIPALDYAEVLTTSAKSGEKVHKIFEAVERAYKQYTANLPTNVVNQVLKEAMFNRKLPVTHGKRLNIYYATQVHSKPPGFSLFCNNSTLLTDEYKQYLEGYMRHAFKLTGTPILLYPRSRRRRNVVNDVDNSGSTPCKDNFLVL